MKIRRKCPQLRVSTIRGRTLLPAQLRMFEADLPAQSAIKPLKPSFEMAKTQRKHARWQRSSQDVGDIRNSAPHSGTSISLGSEAKCQAAKRSDPNHKSHQYRGSQPHHHRRLVALQYIPNACLCFRLYLAMRGVDQISNHHMCTNGGGSYTSLPLRCG